ncbi:MAG: hypothetical protein GF320_12075 [Armatimonadia bacterium]|nr:hypothetical protein [Armatimonadia bacterium]
MRYCRWLVLFCIALLAVSASAQDLVTMEGVNGAVQVIGEGDDEITVLYTWGTPYEMGYAHGKLLTEGVQHLHEVSLGRFMFGIGMGPEEIDAVWAMAEPFVPTADLEEMRGLADGTDGAVSLEQIHRLHIVPEISEWHCTFFAAWGDATSNGNLIQIRALDFATEAAVQEVPLITVAFPDGGQPYLTVGWQGFVGTVTGMNAAKIAMSEIGDDWDKDNDTYEGIPMIFLMKDVVRSAGTLDEAVAMVENAPRTSSYLYCLGDAKIPSARALQTSHAECHVYGPDTLPYDQLADTVYMSMGVDSDWNDKVGGVLADGHGDIDLSFATEDIMTGCGTGDLHAVAFDVTDGLMWLANAQGDIGAIVDGFDRPYVEFDAAGAFQKVAELAEE